MPKPRDELWLARGLGEIFEARKPKRAARPNSFRAFAESRDFCGLELSPLIAAIMDASEGVRPTTISDEQSIEHFGCALAGLSRSGCRTVAVRAGGRGGKTSRLLAPKALHAAWTVPLPTLAPGEVASAILVAPDTKLARQALSFVVGYVHSSPTLTKALEGEPTKEGVEFHRPDGKRVRVEVLAATRGGRGVRARTLVFAGLDEAAFFFDETTGVVNDADVYRAVLQRVVPGGQVWIVSTPWLADTGLLEQTIAKNFGTHEHALCCTAGTRALNPNWDPTGEIERDLREQDPVAATREIDGVPLSSGAATFFEPATLKNCTDDALTLPRAMQHGEVATAGGDFGFKRNSSTLVIAHRSKEVITVGDLLELQPATGAPLKPSEVVGAFAERLRGHAGLTLLMADGHYSESVNEHLANHKLGYIPAPTEVAETYVKVRALMREGRVKMPNHPRLLAQLRAVQWRPNPGGSISIVLPKERTGAHCDLVSALVLAIYQHAGAVFVSKPKPGTPEWNAWNAERIEREALAIDEEAFANRAKQAKPYWKTPKNQAKPYWKEGPGSDFAWQPSPYERRRR